MWLKRGNTIYNKCARLKHNCQQEILRQLFYSTSFYHKHFQIASVFNIFFNFFENFFKIFENRSIYWRYLLFCDYFFSLFCNFWHIFTSIYCKKIFNLLIYIVIALKKKFTTITKFTFNKCKNFS